MGKVESEAEAIYDKLGRGAQSDVKTIAAALEAAEKRGKEEAAKIADNIAAEIGRQARNPSETQLGKSIGTVAAAIRSGQ